MITLTEEPYDSEAAVMLVAALHDEIDQRYFDMMAGWTEEERAADTVDEAADVTGEMVRPPLGVFLVAWLDEVPVGCGALKPLDGVGGVAEIKRMYTSPSGRRRGVGRAVLSELEDRARALGYRRAQLETGTEQPEALALYETDGWQRITPYGRYRDDPSSVCYAKDLPARSARGAS